MNDYRNSWMASSGESAPGRVSPGAVEDGQGMFAAFVACRTTLDDLSGRAAARGEVISGAAIAAIVTGRCDVSDATHNAVADAINARLAELSLPSAVTHRSGSATSSPVVRASASRNWLTLRSTTVR